MIFFLSFSFPFVLVWPQSCKYGLGGYSYDTDSQGATLMVPRAGQLGTTCPTHERTDPVRGCEVKVCWDGSSESAS